MKESEARTKLCPQLRSVEINQNGVEVGIVFPALDDRCITSNCAVWEDWGTKYKLKVPPPEGKTFVTVDIPAESVPKISGAVKTTALYKEISAGSYAINAKWIREYYEPGEPEGECGLITKACDCGS